MMPVISSGKDRPNLSVIIPVYNVESYLARCLDSLLQTEGICDAQIILVDDGSTDKSGLIADGYASAHDCIECYHKENGGLSDARNYGLEKASGRYVFFFDSDDKIIPSSMRKVLETVSDTDADVIVWDGTAIDEKDNDISSGIDLILTHKGLPENGDMTDGISALTKQIKDHGKTAMTAWLRAVRRDYLLDKKLFFEKGLLHEDELWTPQVMAGANSVLYLPEKVYCYRLRTGSITGDYRSCRIEHAKAYIHIMDSLYDYYREHIEDDKSRKVLLSDWADTYLWEISSLGFGRYDIRKQIPRKKIFSCAGSFRSGCKALILLVFGAKIYCYLSR